MNPEFENRKQTLAKCREIAAKIMKELKDEKQEKQLNAIHMITDFPELSGDEEMKQMHGYKEVKEIMKKVYIESAKTIMNILDSSVAYSNDPKISFNYKKPVNQITAAEYIKILPNAFIGGPMKSAIKHPHPKVVKIAVDYYDSLPSDLKYSDVLPADFKNVIRKKKLELNELNQNLSLNS